MALIDYENIGLRKHPCILRHHGVEGGQGMVCYNDPGLFPALPGGEVVARPVIRAFLGPAGIRVRAYVLPDRGPVRPVFFPVSAFGLRGPSDYSFIFRLLIL